MMAFFMVMWLMGASPKVKEAISSYFKAPEGVGKQSGSGAAGSGETLSVSHDTMDNLKDQLEQALKKSPEFEKMKDYVQMSVTGDGLRIELLESEHGMFFQSGSTSPRDMGEEVDVPAD